MVEADPRIRPPSALAMADTWVGPYDETPCAWAAGTEARPTWVTGRETKMGRPGNFPGLPTSTRDWGWG
jgi:hypothetical protein